MQAVFITRQSVYVCVFMDCIIVEFLIPNEELAAHFCIIINIWRYVSEKDF